MMGRVGRGLFGRMISRRIGGCCRGICRGALHDLLPIDNYLRAARCEIIRRVEANHALAELGETGCTGKMPLHFVVVLDIRCCADCAVWVAAMQPIKTGLGLGQTAWSRCSRRKSRFNSGDCSWFKRRLKGGDLRRLRCWLVSGLRRRLVSGLERRLLSWFKRRRFCGLNCWLLRGPLSRFKRRRFRRLNCWLLRGHFSGLDCRLLRRVRRRRERSRRRCH
jgi:hypothetical protein